MAAAHLKPLDKKDKLKFDGERIVGPWNPSANKRSGGIDEKTRSTCPETTQVCCMLVIIIHRSNESCCNGRSHYYRLRFLRHQTSLLSSGGL